MIARLRTAWQRWTSPYRISADHTDEELRRYGIGAGRRM
jgi:hypothetical protein